MSMSVPGNSCRPCNSIALTSGCPVRVSGACVYYGSSKLNGTFTVNVGDTYDSILSNLFSLGLYEDSSTIDFTTSPLSASLKISAAPGNALSALPDGIFAAGLSLTAANNGVSMSSGSVVQLGNDVGVGSAILTNNREVPLSTFSLTFIGPISSSSSSIKLDSTGLTMGIVGVSPNMRLSTTTSGNLLFTNNSSATILQVENSTGNITSAANTIFLRSLSSSGAISIFGTGTGGAKSTRLLFLEPAQFSTSLGINAGVNAGLGQSSVAIGHSALSSSTVGLSNNNTAVGAFSLQNTTTGANNTTIGQGTLFRNVSGSHNVSVGAQIPGNTTQSFATVIGSRAMQTLLANSLGPSISESVAIGYGAGGGNQIFPTNGSALATGCIFIGLRNGLGANNITLSNTTVLANDTITLLSNVCIIGSSTQNVLIGNTVTDNGNKVQITGSQTISGSIGLGVSNINSAAILQADSTTKGFLPPRMTTAQRSAIGSPVAGLVVYDTTLNKLFVYTTAWEQITSA